MKLANWARQQGIDYKTAYRWFRAGILPLPSRQLPTGTILVDLTDRATTGAALYARVSSSDQKDDLDRQVARLARFAANNGHVVVETVSEIGSGLNGKRPRLIRLLADPKIGTIIVEHRDRLARFGVEYIEAALASGGRKLVVVEPGEQKLDIVQDFIDVVTSMCARIYGRRAAKNRARRALEATRTETL